MILKKFLKKINNFGHHGARNGAQTDLTLCAITRPFLKKEPWNVNNFFFNFKSENVKKYYFFSGWIFIVLKFFYGRMFFVWWLRTLTFFANWFFLQNEAESIFFHLWDRWVTNILNQSLWIYKHVLGRKNRKKITGGGVNFLKIFRVNLSDV